MYLTMNINTHIKEYIKLTFLRHDLICRSGLGELKMELGYYHEFTRTITEL